MEVEFVRKLTNYLKSSSVSLRILKAQSVLETAGETKLTCQIIYFYNYPCSES